MHLILLLTQRENYQMSTNEGTTRGAKNFFGRGCYGQIEHS